MSDEVPGIPAQPDVLWFSRETWARLQAAERRLAEAVVRAMPHVYFPLRYDVANAMDPTACGAWWRKEPR